MRVVSSNYPPKPRKAFIHQHETTQAHRNDSALSLIHYGVFDYSDNHLLNTTDENNFQQNN